MRWRRNWWIEGRVSTFPTGFQVFSHYPSPGFEPKMRVDD